MASVGLAYSGAAGLDTDAFGLPEGSVRALIALAVLIAFVGLVVYVLGTIITEPAEKSAAAQTVIGSSARSSPRSRLSTSARTR